MQKVRCHWANKETMHEYHDLEWGVPVHEDTTHFEFLLLEGAQAGLSWETILKRRNSYKEAFANFNVKRVASLTQQDIELLLQNEGIIRNRLKINSAVNNAKRFIEVQKEFESFDKYVWGFVTSTPVNNSYKRSSEVPAFSKEALVLSKDLKKRGFTFVGPTIIYAYMQATGLINDHTTDCFRYKEIVELQK